MGGRYPKEPESFELIGFKFCSKCKTWKPRAMFSKYNNKYDGLQPYCKECTSKKNRKYKEEHAEEIKIQSREWRRKNRKHRAAYQNQRRKKPIVAWKTHLRAETNQMILAGLILHPGCCEVCGQTADTMKLNCHHNSYLAPDDVTFMCEEHHREWHKNNPAPPEPSEEWVTEWYNNYKTYPEGDEDERSLE